MASSGPNFLKSWFLFFLVATVSGAIAGGLIGVVSGGIMGTSGVPLGYIVLVIKVIGFVVGIPISFFTFRWSVRTYIVEPLLQSASQPPALQSTGLDQGRRIPTLEDDPLP